jgi:epsilon-lactone hydrolase
VADDVNLDLVDLDGVHGEWSIAPGSDTTRVLMFFHGGGYCSGSIRSHRRMVTEAGRAGGPGRWQWAIAWHPSIPSPWPSRTR